MHPLLLLLHRCARRPASSQPALVTRRERADARRQLRIARRCSYHSKLRGRLRGRPVCELSPAEPKRIPRACHDDEGRRVGSHDATDATRTHAQRERATRGVRGARSCCCARARGVTAEVGASDVVRTGARPAARHCRSSTRVRRRRRCRHRLQAVRASAVAPPPRAGAVLDAVVSFNWRQGVCVRATLPRLTRPSHLAVARASGSGLLS
jgi:hypothetical protein